MAKTAADEVAVLVVGTADWNQPIATNQHYVVRELAKLHKVTFVESMGLRKPQLGARDLRRIATRLRAFGSRKPASVTRAVPTNVTVRTPLAIPLHVAATRQINRRALRRAAASWLAHPGPRVLWAYTPLTYGLEQEADAFVYHCVDLLGEVPGISAALIDREERRIAPAVTAAAATSEVVAAHLEQTGFAHVVRWPNVADTRPISDAGSRGIRRMPRRAVFAGNLTTTKVDFDLLEQLVDAGMDLHLAGPMSEGGGGAGPQVRALVAAGATYHGHLGYTELAELYWTASVGLIPYQLNSYTKGVSPLKTYEYLAAGLAVVSTPVPSVTPVEGHVDVVAADRSFVDAVLARADAPTAALAAERTAIAERNSWTGRGIEIRHLVDAILPGRDAANLPGASASGSDLHVGVAIRKISFGPGVGGMERAASQHVEQLVERGLRVTLFTPARFLEGSVPTGVDVVDVPWPSWDRGSGTPSFGAAASLWVLRLRRSLDAATTVDLVHLHGIAAGAVHPGRRWSAVHNPHGMEEFSRRPVSREVNRVFLRALSRRGRLADRVIATDESLVDAVRSNIGAPDERIALIPNSVDVGNLQRLAREGDHHRGGVDVEIVSIGRLVRNKGYDLLLDALKTDEVRARLAGSWRWTHFGAGPERSSLEQAATRAPAVPLEIRSGRPDAEVQAALSTADVFVQPSRYEGSSLTTLEAMAHGVVIAARAVGGIPDKIDDGVSGFLAFDETPESVAAALLRGLEAARDEVGAAASRAVEERFSAEATADAYIALYRALHGGRAVESP